VQRRLAELGVQTPQSTQAAPADVDQDEAPVAPPVAEDQLDEIGDTPAGKAALRAVQNRADDTMDAWSKNSASGFSATPKQVSKATGAAVAAGNRLHGFGPDRMRQDTVMARDALRKQLAVAEAGANDRQWSNKDMERLRRAETELDDIFGTPDDSWTKTKQSQIKKRIQTKPMTGPKGVLPEQGMAEDQLDELSVDTLNSYADKAKGQRAHAFGRMQAAQQGNQAADPTGKFAKTWDKRATGYNKAVAKGANDLDKSGTRSSWSYDQDMTEGDNQATFVENNELARMLKHAGVPVSEGVLKDDTRNTWDHLLDRFRHEVEWFKQTGDLADDLYDALFDYYSHHGAMPYGVAKARTGDPHSWVSDRLAQDLGIDEGVLGTVGGAALGSMLGGPVGAAAGAVGGQEMTKGGSGLIEGSCNMTAEGEYCPEHGLAECGGMYEDGGAVGMPYSMGEAQAPQDPINYNAAMTGAYYEGKETRTQEGDALLARIKSLALLK
jgi:hypothetical protein